MGPGEMFGVEEGVEGLSYEASVSCHSRVGQLFKISISVLRKTHSTPFIRTSQEN
jgi:hypothetical protein